MKGIEILWHILKFPFVQLYAIFKFLIIDTIGDIKFLIVAAKKTKDNENVLDPEKVSELKREMKDILTGKVNAGDIIKSVWIWIVIILFTANAWFILGTMYAEAKFNEYMGEMIESKKILINENAFITEDYSYTNLSNISIDFYASSTT